MKLYEIRILPLGGFGTPLKGDTLFGHFCWQAANNPKLLNTELEKQISIYHEKPFVIFSSAFPSVIFKKSTHYFFKRPDLPISFLFPSIEKDRIKEFEKKKWMKIEDIANIDLSKQENFLNDKGLLDEIDKEILISDKLEHPQFMKTFSQPHNKINRMTQTTGKGEFAPYVKENTYYYPETELSIFVLIEESATDIERVYLGLENIGKWGYGRDASTGMGRFKLCEYDEITLFDNNEFNACYTLAPSVPQRNCFAKNFFTPFTRFGKHGDMLVYSKNPFKNPVIMADEGAVFIPCDKAFFKKPYIGRAITGVSKSMPQTVTQGYAPYLPFKLEGINEI
ncbi:MAG: hypothetical protein HQK78_17465 [Desulfobacterales bacterium]|nr:hypothetical protein [Desulfobacterales bacterium]